MTKHSFFVKKKKLAYSKGPIHVVDCEVEVSSGRVLSRQILQHAGAVVIIPRLARNRFILIRQFRFAARDWLWEWPAGGVEKGESLRRAAARELREEVGYHPQKLRKLVTFYPTPGVSSERMHLFLADRLRVGKGIRDEDEEIEIHDFSLQEIGRMIRKGLIQDAKTMIGYFFLKNV